ncbi:RNA polymerase sigma-70 factor (ECF subfamily) [Chitinophaga niastensis]|uniref:RNA polymerase sigma-70 factor (ECF subfamily) n=1 Tax=Chitinophaga niastensis TaxID=536980 RepID=A0A2P8HKF9_CHINA|nr:sigma-70 family RNA polymerase sigma factor [Chitinophaga niastensis]PSL46704.1 RNA polymerase sigma-70 factor (ECF subfamily) [Chitinophaga niastensis]
MSIASLPDEQELLKQVALGDKNAYTILFHHYSKQVFDVGMLYLKDNGLSREIVQEIFLKVWLKKEEMNMVKNFKDYLFILTRNHIYDGFKKQMVRLKAYDLHHQNQPAAGNDTDHLLIEREYEKLIDSAVSCLPPERKKVYLARNQGFSNEEISIRLNISIHTVKKQMSIAVHAVRAFVKAHLQNDILLLIILLITRK